MATTDSADDEVQTHYAVGLEHLFWEAADDEEEAIEMARKKLAEMDEDDLRDLDFDVFDSDEF